MFESEKGAKDCLQLVGSFFVFILTKEKMYYILNNKCYLIYLLGGFCGKKY